MGQENTNKTLTMKDTNGKTITEEEFMKDMGHGVERTQENWKEEFDKRFVSWKIHHSTSPCVKDTYVINEIQDFISTLLAEERIKQHALGYKFGYEDGYSSQWKENYTKAFEQDIRNAVLSEVEREVEKKQYYSDDGQQYVTSIEDISTIINNLKVK